MASSAWYLLYVAGGWHVPCPTRQLIIRHLTTAPDGICMTQGRRGPDSVQFLVIYTTIQYMCCSTTKYFSSMAVRTGGMAAALQAGSFEGTIYAAALFAHGGTPDYRMRLILLSSLRKNTIAAACSGSCSVGARKPVPVASFHENSVLHAFSRPASFLVLPCLGACCVLLALHQASISTLQLYFFSILFPWMPSSGVYSSCRYSSVHIAYSLPYEQNLYNSKYKNYIYIYIYIYSAYVIYIHGVIDCFIFAWKCYYRIMMFHGHTTADWALSSCWETEA